MTEKIKQIRILLERYDMNKWRCRIVKYDYPGMYTLTVAYGTNASGAVKGAVKSFREEKKLCSF